eukprot:3414942-Pleurochrysis_carterae.AAC.3
MQQRQKCRILCFTWTRVGHFSQLSKTHGIDRFPTPETFVARFSKNWRSCINSVGGGRRVETAERQKARLGSSGGWEEVTLQSRVEWSNANLRLFELGELALRCGDHLRSAVGVSKTSRRHVAGTSQNRRKNIAEISQERSLEDGARRWLGRGYNLRRAHWIGQCVQWARKSGETRSGVSGKRCDQSETGHWTV